MFHRNVSAAEAMEEMGKAMEDSFRQLDVETMDFQAVALVSKKGKITIKKKKSGGEKRRSFPFPITEQKIYSGGRKAGSFSCGSGCRRLRMAGIVKSRYDKFRQINRFLEFIADIMPILPKDRCVRIIDFRLRQKLSDLAMYYYLHELCGLDIPRYGAGFEKEVIRHCQELADKYGYEGLEFCRE